MSHTRQQAVAWINSAIAANSKGQFERAAKLCRRAVSVCPNIPEAWFNLAVALRGMQRREEAGRALHNTLSLARDSAGALNSVGLEFYYLGVLDEARRCFVQAIQLAPGFALAYSNMGMLCEHQGQLRQAKDYFAKALALAPELAPLYLNLAGALNNLEEYEQALTVATKALQLDPMSSAAYNNRSAALAGLGRFEEALEDAQKAVKLDPNSSQAYNTLSLALSALGHRQEAIAGYERALRIAPGDAEVHRNFSLLKQYTPEDPQISLAQSLIDDPATGEQARMHLSFMLGKAYDDIGETDQAFAYFLEGNRQRKKQLGYDIAQDRQLFRTIKSRFVMDPVVTLGLSEVEVIEHRPIFVLGLPRSGTTLVEQILSSHPQVFGAGELEGITRAVRSQVAWSGEETLITPDTLHRIRRNYMDFVKTRCISAPVFTDKMPLNFRWIGFIATALPEARIVHLNRDPVATCWSIFKHYFSAEGNRFSYDLADLGEYYKLYVDLMAFWRDKLPRRIYDLDYEGLTENQEVETRKLLEYCGLEWEPQCLEFHKHKRAVATVSQNQVRQRMYTGSSEVWKRYERHLGALIEILRGPPTTQSNQ